MTGFWRSSFLIENKAALSEYNFMMFWVTIGLMKVVTKLNEIDFFTEQNSPN